MLIGFRNHQLSKWFVCLVSYWMFSHCPNWSHSCKPTLSWFAQFDFSVGLSVRFFLCSTSGFRPALPMIGFTCHFTWQVYKRLSSAPRYYFVNLCLHECWACSLSAVVQGSLPNQWVITASSVQLSPSPRYLASERVFGTFFVLTSYRAL